MHQPKKPNLRGFEKTVERYEAQPIEPGKIVFYGSSGFTNWQASNQMRPLEEDIRMKDGSLAAVNHGFGGGTMEEGLYYYDRLIKPWAPRAVVLRFYPNDIGAGYTPEEIVYLHALFCHRAKADFPDIKIYLCDAMPHKRYVNNSMWQKMAHRFNRTLQDFCRVNDNCFYVCQSAWPGFYEDPADAGDYSKVRQDIWVADEMHFTQEGYDIYRELFLNALDDIL